MDDEKIFDVDGKSVSLEDLIKGYKNSKKRKVKNKKAVRKYNAEQELKPYQAELIKLQKHLEETNKK